MGALKLLVVGGVAAGASFAARARRLDESAEITLIERGPDVSFANCGLPYHIGGEIPARDVLAVQTSSSLKDQLNLNVFTQCEAIDIDHAGKKLQVKDLVSGRTEWLRYDKLMLSPGASPVRPPLPGIDDPRIFTLRNLQDMDRIIAAANTGMRAVIIGAGFIGLEMAEQLQRRGMKVQLVELMPQVIPPLDAPMAALLDSELRRNGVEVFLGDGIRAFRPGDSHVGCELNSGAVLDADLVILSIGVKPDSDLAKRAGLELGARGHIVVDAFQRTSDPNIYAAGDVVETQDRVVPGRTTVPMGGPANRQGRVAADHIFLGDKARPYPGSIGTGIVRAFDVVAGITGWSEKRLRALQYPFASVTVNDSHHASYYPGAKPMTLKIVWDARTGRLLGAQATGFEGIDKRLDVLSTAIAAEMTIEDLCHLELAYAPPFGSAKDIINLAGFAACNRRDGLVKHTETLPTDPAVQIVDVRGKPLAEAYPAPATVLNIPFATLRANLGKLDKNRPVVTLCAFGKMSYFAARVLAQNGFEVSSYSGGLKANVDPRTPAKLPTA
ncbi:FAD-dependent oxidoreductase [Propionivibrio dicarboxylicus]|uniref:NADPH-dependent 2,4-dienoyl-CoA reductase, sulfur reductase n=1 Tax=Propionivibrio dicarboxylicus TaxID=83767 RepID=A0A1G8EYV8_9RHOO|nr:FAD-dependent oxidoreductase [Propionivibrio dicarboxylicus]SDH75024.1 NADPH-dependent 2,4-dienoyl-CoA reductase, sulfur reductase [Propionivibrio dicarboxylicus]